MALVACALGLTCPQRAALALAGPASRTSQASHAASSQTQSPATVDTAAVAAREQAARQAMAEGRYDDAAQGYRALLAAMPNEPGLLMNLGMALAMGGHSREAIEPLTAATTRRPALLPAWLFLGSAYLDLGQPDRAIAPLRHFVAAQPDHADSRQMLATALLVTEHPREALPQYLRLTRLAAGDAKTWVGLVQCYDALAQQALQQLRQAPGAEADVFQQLILADALESEDKNEQAFALYRRALDTLPRFTAIHDALAQIYDKTGHADWATAERAKVPAKASAGSPADTLAPVGDRTDLRSRAGTPDGTRRVASAANAGGCVPHRPDCEFRARRYANVVTGVAARADAESHYWRARAYAELALEAFAHLAALPESQELHELKAELFRNEGRHHQSVDELKLALTFAPNDPRLTKELAKSYYLSRDAEHARPLLRTLVDRVTDDPEIPLLYGEVLLDAQSADEALPYLKTAAARDPSSIDAHAALGRALVQLGQPADAIPHLKAALPQDEDGSLRYQLARAYQATGQPDLARPLLDEYQTLQHAAAARAQASSSDAKITPP
jgi:predicted Zn-dependent protease